MSEQQQNQNVEIAGMGVQLSTPIKVQHRQIWAAMVDQIYNAEKYLPVTDVEITDVVSGRHAYREMKFRGKLLRENIYFNEALYEIRAASADKDKIRVLIYHPDSELLDYWLENGNGERISWNMPKAVVLEAMKKIKEVAEAESSK